MNHLQTATWLAELLDNRIKIGKFGFGLDPLLNFIPFGGATVGLMLSLYTVWIAVQCGAPASVRYRMIFNTIVDFILSIIPGVGWVFDFVYQANIMNLNLLKRWLATQPNQPLEGQVLYSQVVNR